MRVFKRDEIDKYKRQARAAYMRFRYLMNGYDCGAELLKTISPDASKAAEDYRHAMSKLQDIDPQCPKWSPL